MNKNTPARSKAERILAAIRKPANQGKTAAEIARAADVDHNHVYIFEQLCAQGFLRRNKGRNERQLEGFEKKTKGGRGSIYFPGRKLLKAGETSTQTVTATVTKAPAKTRTAKPATARTKKTKEVAAEKPAAVVETPAEIRQITL